MRKLIFYVVLIIIGAALWSSVTHTGSKSSSAAPIVAAADASGSVEAARSTIQSVAAYAGFSPEVVIAQAQSLIAIWKKPTDNVGMTDDQVDQLINALGEAGQIKPKLAAQTAAITATLVKLKTARASATTATIAAAIADDTGSRDDYAGEAERNFLSKGMDVSVRTSGNKHTTLTISYVLMGRPTVYQLVNDGQFLPNLRALGFKTVVFTDGYDSTWRYNLVKDAFY